MEIELRSVTVKPHRVWPFSGSFAMANLLFYKMQCVKNAVPAADDPQYSIWIQFL